MLEDLLDSTPESTALAFMLLAPPRAFSAMELSARLGVKDQAFAKIMASLLQHAYIKQFSKGGVKYFIINSKNTIFPEIRAALVKGRQLYEDELFLALKKLPGITAAFLSGLFVGKTELPVDMLLVGNVKRELLDTFIGQCQKMMQQELNYSIMTEQEFLERRNTFDRFIKDIFDYPHLVVINKIKK